ncbi:hypothetical protein MMC13_000330 [Lambiella insularis]|nr:hypothetical protein [Lambiella insularis]
MAPSERRLEEALRNAVQIVYKTGDLEELTVKRMRKAAEESLHLQDGFFKDSEDWKNRSKRIIEQEAEALSNAAANEPEISSQLESPEVPQQATKSAMPRVSGPRKRASMSEPKPKKRRKMAEKIGLDDDLSGHQSPDAVDNAWQTAAQEPSTHNSTINVPDQGISDVANGGVNNDSGQTPLEPIRLDDVAESEMSDVIDEGPKPTRKRRSGSGEAKVKVAKKPKAKQKVVKPQETDPDAEEIKRLQGWLIKCGIRKMWYKELASFETSKAKIRHLKEMLANAGMVGRYSADKAAEIKETRELQADLESVQAGAKQWGKAESEDEPARRPRRRLAKGLQSLDFLNDEDGEETD